MIQLRSGGGTICLAYIAASIAVAVPTSALACRCVRPTPERAFRTADSIVLAQVMNLEETGYRRSYRITVRSAWKRPQPRDLTIMAGPGNCGASFTVGQVYLIYLSPGVNGTPSTSHCSANVPAEEAAHRMPLLGRPVS